MEEKIKHAKPVTQGPTQMALEVCQAQIPRAQHQQDQEAIGLEGTRMLA